MTPIEFTILGNSGIKVSKVCLGTWAIGGWMWGGADDDNAIKTIHTALSKGINFIDTAPVYGFGHSEEIVGKAVSQYSARREDIILATKVGLEWSEDGKVMRNSTRGRIEKEIEDSLKRLQTDYIDLYQVHWPDTAVPFEETATTLKSLLDSGKIRAVGVSNFSPAQMDEFKKYCPLHSVQPPYNLFERAIDEDVRPYALENGLAILAYGAICRGLLSGKMSLDRKFIGDDLRQYDPKFQSPRFEQYLTAVDKLDSLAKTNYDKGVLALALRWVLDRGAIALWGARQPHQLDAVDSVFGWKINQEDMAAIDTILGETVTDPVGPEFMAPPVRA